MSRIHEINTAEFKHGTPDGDKLIAEIARVSNPANEKNHETAPRLIRFLIANNHWSPFQMCSMAIEVNTTRDIGRQILRHLSAIGYQEFSGRYAAYNELLDYRECRFQHPTNRQLSREPETPEEREIAAEWNTYIREKARQDEADYKLWLSKGVAKECARAILPEGLVPTRMYLHYSIRTWLHYIEERTKEGVQKEHRIIAGKCQMILCEQFPMTYEAFFGSK
jgi:thymidylate synthase (FAD)